MKPTVKQAIHFGISSDVGADFMFDGSREADYFHLMLKQRGYESDVFHSEDAPICAETIKAKLKDIVSEAEQPGNYFVSISGLSYVERKWLTFNPKNKRKAVLLSDLNTFTRKDLLDCLALFGPLDRVFFLISDCEQNKNKVSVKNYSATKNLTDINAKAVVLSLGLNHRAMRHLNVTSGAIDFEYALNRAKTPKELVELLEQLNDSNIGYVNSSLGCYNVGQNSEFMF